MAPLEVHHGTACRAIKGEDVIVARCLDAVAIYPAQSMLFMICDGHAGKEAAAFVAKNFATELCEHLPSIYPQQPEGMEGFAQLVRLAMCESFARLDNKWLETGNKSGTTVTAALMIGPLLTVANIGDSDALLHCGTQLLHLTQNHRLDTNDRERARLVSAGCRVAAISFDGCGPALPDEDGLGPLRVWPGAICMSRSIGDIEAGREVLPIPHVRQVLLDDSFADTRLILASDGLWDAMSKDLVLQLSSSRHCCQQAATDLVRISSSNHQVIDDTSIIVVDIWPMPALRHAASSPLTPQGSMKKEHSSFGLFSCLGLGGAEAPQPRASPSRSCTDGQTTNTSSRAPLRLLADEDGLEAWPLLRSILVRNFYLPPSFESKPERLKTTRSMPHPPNKLSEFAALATVWNKQQSLSMRSSDEADTQSISSNLLKKYSSASNVGAMATLVSLPTAMQSSSMSSRA